MFLIFGIEIDVPKLAFLAFTFIGSVSLMVQRAPCSREVVQNCCQRPSVRLILLVSTFMFHSLIFYASFLMIQLKLNLCRFFKEEI